MKITLLRHGKPAVELSGTARADELGKIAKAYESSSIVDVPSLETRATLRHHRIVLCSDLPRSVESAQALGFREIYSPQPLFREASLPYFSGGSIALPISAWLTILRLLWLAGFSQNGDSYADTKIRARKAAARLVDLAEEHEHVLLVGHGVINYLIAKELLSKGWLGPAKPRSSYWEFDVYQRELS
jgi:broad specificity phosphatase PhoE